MNSAFATLSSYFWVICLGFSYFNYAKSLRQLDRSKGTGLSDRSEHRRYLQVFSAAGALPWMVMGLGQITGFTPTVWYYFRPQDKNPFVLAWLALIFLTAVIFAVWALFRGGAENVRKYDLLSAVGMRSITPPSLWLVKLYAAAGPFFVIVWIALAISMDAKVPQ